jgi:hypothetical protein
MGYKPGSSGGGGSAATGETITAATVSGSGTVISKNKTISKPTIPAAVYLALPSASAAVAYQEYEVKDGAGDANLRPITITTLSGSIDGVAEDLIDARWGSKSYYTDGANWFVKNESTKELGVESGGSFSYSQAFPGADNDPLPTGWSAVRSDPSNSDWHANTSEWLVQSGIYPASSPNTSSAGAHCATSYHLPIAYPAAESQTLTYNTTTFASGTVISFKWMKDFYHYHYHDYLFKINGILVETFADGDNGTWQVVNYTIPSTGLYTLTWHWDLANDNTARYAYDGKANGCFIDEFTIT